MQTPRFLLSGDGALTVEFGDAISDEVNARVCALDRALARDPIAGVTETIPTFRSLLICYDSARLTAAALRAAVEARLASCAAAEARPRRVLDLPVCYGGAHGPDLPDVARLNGLSEDEVVALHAGRAYLIYMLGFLPGFAYLGGLDPRIHTPRLATPRTRIEPGAVGIGGSQTGVYPLASPGGWRLIGSTPVRPYDPARETPILYSAGDYIRFVPVTAREYDLLAADVAAGRYAPVWTEGGAPCL